MKGRAPIAAIALAFVLSGCRGWQSALDPKGPQAHEIARLFWIFTGLLSAIFVLVMIALLIAVLMRRGPRSDPLLTNPGFEHRAMVVVVSLAVLTGVTVLALTGISYSGQRDLFRNEEGTVSIRITGHQWWWEIRYEEPDASRTFTTANEIHVPVGKPVKITLNSADVIHSFWVPSLMGKQDLITGRQNDIRFIADRPGIYRGQCAEFCGFQHAHMSLFVVAEEQVAFERWRDAQIKSADPPSDPERQKGLQAFLSQPCVMCHSVRGPGGRQGRARSHAHRQPQGACCRHATDEPRQPRGLDRRSARDQAWRQHADHEARAGRREHDRGLSGGSEVRPTRCAKAAHG